jgi:hypothetical protein
LAGFTPTPYQSGERGAFPFFRSTGEKRRIPKLKIPGS